MNSTCTALSPPCLFPANRLSALPSKFGTGTNVHASAPTSTNASAMLLAQTSTKKLASASASSNQMLAVLITYPNSALTPALVSVIRAKRSARLFHLSLTKTFATANSVKERALNQMKPAQPRPLPRLTSQMSKTANANATGLS